MARLSPGEVKSRIHALETSSVCADNLTALDLAVSGLPGEAPLYLTRALSEGIPEVAQKAADYLIGQYGWDPLEVARTYNASHPDGRRKRAVISDGYMHVEPEAVADPLEGTVGGTDGQD